MGGKKRPTIKCSSDLAKNSSRKAELLDSDRGRSQKKNGDRRRLARELFTREGFARAFSRTPKLHREAVRKSRGGGLRRAIDPRRQPDEMAPRPHHLVLRNVHPEKMEDCLSR